MGSPPGWPPLGYTVIMAYEGVWDGPPRGLEWAQKGVQKGPILGISLEMHVLEMLSEVKHVKLIIWGAETPILAPPETPI